MNWHPEREERVKRHSLDYRVPRDRQLDSIEISRPGDVTVVTDTLFPVYCDLCDTLFTGPTNARSVGEYTEHMEAEHPQMPKQYIMPDWFREMKHNREADIFKLQYDNEDHDY